jgi:NitT/TauT family transport system ATP-binding protein
VDRLRVRLARALALDPEVLLLEHASAGLPEGSAHALGAGMRAVASRRGAAIIAATADQPFAAAVAGRVLVLEPGTGRLKGHRGFLGSWFKGSKVPGS